MAFGQRLQECPPPRGSNLRVPPPICRVSARVQSIPPHRLPSTWLEHNIYRFLGREDLEPLPLS